MPCDPATSSLNIVFAEGENNQNGDNDPANGAFMRWQTTGSSTGLYYFEIVFGTSVFPVNVPGSANTIFIPGNPGDPVDVSIDIGMSLNTMGCLPSGNWILRTWEAIDLDLDGFPDRDNDGNVIGCFVEEPYTFFPSCPDPSITQFTVDPRDIGCNNATGSISLFDFTTDQLYCVDTDGNGATFTWTGPNGFTSSNRDISGLEPGVYRVIVEDFYGCTSIWFREIRILDNVAVDCRAVPPTTFGGSDGQAILDITAGTGNYTIEWTGTSSGMTTGVDGENVIPNLTEGTYNFTITDNISECVDMCTVVITPPPCLLNITCSINDDEDVVITINGGSANYFISYGGPSVMDNVGPFGDEGITFPGEDFDPGQYVFTVYEEDRPDCRAFCIIDIPGPDCTDLVYAILDQEDISCAEADDGRIRITVSGDFNPVPTWSGPNITGTNDTLLENLEPGIYSLQIIDDRSCFADTTITLTEPPTLEFDCGGVDETFSFLDDGKIGLTMDGGTPPYQLSYTAVDPTGSPLPGASGLAVMTGDTLRNLMAGTYNLVLTDQNNCMATCTAIIGEFVCDLAVNPVINFISCTDEVDGSIDLNVTGADDGLIIDWNFDQYDGQQFVSGLGPGSYSITVTDDTGCPLPPIEVELVNPDPLLLDLTNPVLVRCNGDSSAQISAQVSGGVGLINYDWSVGTFPNAAVVNNLPAGTYWLNVTDENGCFATDTIVVAEAPLLDISCSAESETVAGARDGSIRVVISGTASNVVLTGDLGIVPLSPGADTTFTDLPPGNYDLVVTNSNGCSVVCSSIINQGGCQTDVSVDVTQPDCDNALGTATAVPSMAVGRVRYNWSHGPTTQTVTNLDPGAYSVIITDDLACRATANFIINAFTDFPRLRLLDFTPACDDGCAELEVDVSGTSPFLIRFTRQRNGGAIVMDSVQIIDDGAIQFCPADFGYPDLGGVLINLLDITDGNGCSRPLNVPLDVPQRPVARGNLDTTICPGGQLRFFGEIFNASRRTGEVVLPNGASNGCDSIIAVNLDFFAPARGALDTTLCLNGELRFGGQLFNLGRPTGTVRLTGASANGCDSIVDVSLDFFPEATGTLDTAICEGGRLVYFGQVFSEGRRTGTVRIPSIAANGCDSIVDVRLSFLEPPMGQLDTTVCTGPPFRYFGQTFGPDRTNGIVRLPNGAANGCDSLVEVNVTVIPPPIGQLDTAICEGDSFRKGGVLFDEPIINRVTLTGELGVSGCDSLVSVTVRFLPTGTVILSGDGIICPDGEVNIDLTYTGTEIATIELSTDPGVPINLNPGDTTIQRLLPPGTRVSILNALDGGSCPMTSSGELTVTTTDLAVDIMILSGDENLAISCNDGEDGAIIAVASGGSTPYAYLWENGATTAPRGNLPAGTYSVLVTSDQGCEVRDTVQLFDPEPIRPTITEIPPDCLHPAPRVVIDSLNGGVGPFLVRLAGAPGFRPVATLPDTLTLPEGRSTVEFQDANGCMTFRDFDFLPLPPSILELTPRNAVIDIADSVEIRTFTNLNAVGYFLSPGPAELLTQNSFIVAPDVSTTYTVTAVDAAGCTATDSVRIIVDREVSFYAPTAFSPNNDGVNDLFRLYGRETIEGFSDLYIYDRWGNQVFVFEGPVGPGEDGWGWNGESEDGEPYNPAVFVYTILVNYVDGRSERYSGEFALVR
ncbi:gliding motility-associated C-terminal domain-containing protein [Lewinella sp. W8]|uniref:T9SS type B sorting domain-containing protein n=1 Tax=Lewinella sp. W8 TaxID=2528208 RepID=UPI0015661E04|nr:gliding motility-associated C-terminal domain-containing protein [Lewinella sp. W8]